MDNPETPTVGDEERSEEETSPSSPDDSAPEVRDNDPLLEYRQRKAALLKGATEHRQFTVNDLECRTLDDGTIRMSGYGSVTEAAYDIGDPERGGFRETIRRGAFKRTLSEQPDTVLLLNHEGAPLARTTNGSLALSEDARGLRWDADLDPEDPQSRVLARKVDTGLLDQCSFAFRCTDETWNDAYTERTIKSVTIHRGDVSLVTMGANPATSVSLRSLSGALKELRAGKAISAASMEVLTRVLGLVSAADDAVDEAQPLLADLMGVENPDDDSGDSGTEGDGEDSGSTERSAPPPKPQIPDHTTRAHERLATLRRVSR